MYVPYKLRCLTPGTKVYFGQRGLYVPYKLRCLTPLLIGSFEKWCLYVPYKLRCLTPALTLLTSSMHLYVPYKLRCITPPHEIDTYPAPLYVTYKLRCLTPEFFNKRKNTFLKKGTEHLFINLISVFRQSRNLIFFHLRCSIIPQTVRRLGLAEYVGPTRPRTLFMCTANLLFIVQICDLKNFKVSY